MLEIYPSKNKLTEKQIRQFKRSAWGLVDKLKIAIGVAHSLNNSSSIRLGDSYGNGLFAIQEDIEEFCIGEFNGSYMDIMRARERLYTITAGNDNASRWLIPLEGIKEVSEFRQRFDQINLDMRRLFHQLPGSILPFYIPLTDPFQIQLPETCQDIAGSLISMTEYTDRLIGDYAKTGCRYAEHAEHGAIDGNDMVRGWIEAIDNNPSNIVYFTKRLISTGYAYQSAAYSQLLSRRKNAVEHYQWNMALAKIAFTCAKIVRDYARMQKEHPSKIIIYGDVRRCRELLEAD